MKKNVFVFDLDGVLVTGEGYKQAFRQAIHFLCEQAGMEDFTPSSEVHSYFEAIGISSEWEMTPIFFAFLLENAMIHDRDPLPETLEDLLKNRTMEQFQWDEKDHQKILNLRPFLLTGEKASQSILRYKDEIQRQGIFSIIGNFPIFLDLLSDTHDVFNSISCQLIQTFANGSVIFEKTSGIKSKLDCDPFLQKYDQPCLAESYRASLMKAYQSKELNCVICTARPSLPPKNAPLDTKPYFPEAEMGRQAIGLPDFPLVGWGGMQSLGIFTGRNPSEFLKPQPVQTLAAICMALGMDYWDSLLLAYQICHLNKDQNLGESLRIFPEEMNLTIFEDLQNGLIAGKKVKEVLENLGVKINLRLYGITHIHEKAKSLSAIGATVVETVNDAVKLELKKVDLESIT